MNITPIPAFAALAVIGTLGFTAGRITTGSPAPSPGGTSETSARAARSSSASSNREASATRTQSARRESSTRAAASSREQRTERLESIVRGEDPLNRGRALLAFIDQLGANDFEEAVAHFRSLGITESRMGEYAMLLSAWAKTDPIAALEYAKANTGNNFATNTILTSWAATDAEGAIRWAETNHQGDEPNPYFAGIIRSLAETDPLRATDLLTSMPRSVERGEALDAMVPHLLRQGTEATRSWIEGLSDDALKNGAMLRVAERLAANDPAGTAEWLLANPGDAAQRRIDDVYSVWARQDEQAAMASMVSLPPGENRSNALRGLVTSVASENPSAAVSIMDRFPADVTDRVVQHFIWHSFGTDPSTAVNQISRIADQNDRDQMYRRAVGRWLENDSAAATAWLQSNPLPQNVMDELNRRLTRQ